MYEYKHMFNRRVLINKLKNYKIEQIPNINHKIKILTEWQYNIKNGNLLTLKETTLQGKFLDSFFVQILDYKDAIGHSEWSIEPELSTSIDSTKPDAVLGFLSSSTKEARAVIELKDANTDLDSKQKNRVGRLSPVEQAFLYAPKYGSKCKWIIVSNFLEIRLYNSSSQLEYERFWIADLTNADEFIRFYFLLNSTNLLNKDTLSLTEDLYAENQKEEIKITKAFYEDYKSARTSLFNYLAKHNDINQMIILEKTQKILDRFIFICFSQSVDLLPSSTLKNLYQSCRMSFDNTRDIVWKELKLLFKSIDIGNLAKKISKLNGGLFKEDMVLDSLLIPDSVLYDLEKFLSYDFTSDLNINILGHIFEQSINDIEELKLNLRNSTDSSYSKRKSNGIYYTPDYITTYIVQESLSILFEDIKKSLAEDRLPIIPSNIDINDKKQIYKKNKNIKEQLKFWENYKDKLSSIKILDLACGSGAFLNQALDFLYNEKHQVANTLADLRNGQANIFDLEKETLKNSIYGVDLNQESVEISRLSLWIRTANKFSTLASLDDNIKCGNSIVDDSVIEPEKLFVWEKEFESIISTGGFDIIIGNPPYLDSEEMTRTQPIVRDYCRKKYLSAKGNWDIFIIFIEQGLRLLKDGGILSFVVPNKLLSASYSEKLRNILLDYQIIEFRDYSSINVFEDADIYPIIFLVKKSQNKIPVKMSKVINLNELPKLNYINPNLFYRDIYWDRYFQSNQIAINIIEKMLSFSTLGRLADVSGASTVNEAYELKKILSEYDNTYSNKQIFRFINTGTIDKYISLWGKQNTRYIKKAYKRPIVLRSQLLKLSQTRYNQALASKIIIGGMSKELECLYDDGNYLAGKSTTIIIKKVLDLKYILAILNSKLISFFYKVYFSSLSLQGGYLQISPTQIKMIPIADVQERHKHLIRLVDKLHYQIEIDKNLNDTIKQIDSIVYELFRLSEDEINYVEQNF